MEVASTVVVEEVTKVDVLVAKKAAVPTVAEQRELGSLVAAKEARLEVSRVAD